jgi:hypothetical protein
MRRLVSHGCREKWSGRGYLFVERFCENGIHESVVVFYETRVHSANLLIGEIIWSISPLKGSRIGAQRAVGFLQRHTLKGSHMIDESALDDFERLARESDRMAVDYPERLDWNASPFAWILTLPSATRGKVGRDLVAAWAYAAGFDVQRVSEDRQLYVVINGHKVQVKLSTLWKTGIYRFQQIRDRDYDYCLLIGLSPHDVHAWLVPKSALDEYVIGHLGQHTGADSNETYWLDAGPNAVAPWLEPFGNRLEDAGARFQTPKV